MVKRASTRATVWAAENLANRLNSLPDLGTLASDERQGVVAILQRWLFDRVSDYFNRQRIQVEINLEEPGAQIVASILKAATTRGAAGAVAQHLVGAKLALRYPQITVENHSFTTADQQLGRPGDFIIRDTAFHITVAPTESVIRRCAQNLRNGFRTHLLVPESKLEAARQLAENDGLRQRIGASAIEAFVGQNIEEIGEYGKATIATGFRLLLEMYNTRVAEVETNLSLLIDIPENLQ